VRLPRTKQAVRQFNYR